MTVKKCPLCAADVEYLERHPNRVCDRCASKTSDAYGRRLKFGGDAFPGSLRAVYLDSGEEYTRRLCYIDGRKCFVHENRSGGVIVETIKD